MNFLYVSDANGIGVGFGFGFGCESVEGVFVPKATSPEWVVVSLYTSPL